MGTLCSRRGAAPAASSPQQRGRPSLPIAQSCEGEVATTSYAVREKLEGGKRARQKDVAASAYTPGGTKNRTRPEGSEGSTGAEGSGVTLPEVVAVDEPLESGVRAAVAVLDAVALAAALGKRPGAPKVGIETPLAPFVPVALIVVVALLVPVKKPVAVSGAAVAENGAASEALPLPLPLPLPWLEPVGEPVADPLAEPGAVAAAEDVAVKDEVAEPPAGAAVYEAKADAEADAVAVAVA